MLFKAVAFYEYDTKQQFIKNTADNYARKVMITGVMTENDKSELLQSLKKLGEFTDESISLKRGIVNELGEINNLVVYIPGTVLNRGDAFIIFVQSQNESNLSKMEGGADGSNKLFYKAKVVCRVEKSA
jgi:hypothetical protein